MYDVSDLFLAGWVIRSVRRLELTSVFISLTIKTCKNSDTKISEQKMGGINKVVSALIVVPNNAT